MGLDGPRKATLAALTFLDEPEQPRQEEIAVVMEDERHHGRKLLRVNARRWAKGSRKERSHARLIEETNGEAFIWQAEKPLLAFGEMCHFDVNAAVGDDAPGHLHSPTTLHLAGEQFPCAGYLGYPPGNC